MGRPMKDSGVEWIGEIPEQWKKNKVVRLFDEIGSGTTPKSTDENAYAGDINWLQSGDINGTILSEVKNRVSASVIAEYSALKIYKAPFIVVAMYGASVGKVSLSEIDACANQACCVLAKPLINLNYAFYSMKSAKDYLIQKAVGGGQPNISQDVIKQLRLPMPSIEEQSRIAAYLDKQCRNIDLTIDKTTSSIEEYKKLKQAIITQAVTKGVRGERPMKDSGVEWIGEIPEEWRVTQLRHCAVVKSGITLGKTYPAGTELVEMPYLRVANVQDGHVDLSDVTTLEVTRDEVEKYSLREGSVLMTEGGDRDKLGRGCVWDGSIAPCLHQNHIFAVDTDRNALDPYFLSYLTTSRVGRDYFDVTAVKTTNLACTSSSKVLAYVIPLPDAAEQNEIVGYLDTKCAAIDALIAQKQQLLTELQNYKKSLIYEYVTGKKEVPAV